MSEYQYYEFVAVDRLLTAEEMIELRAISTRAQVTPSRMTNTYSYGDFRGDPEQLVVDCFDAHVYVANWGSRTLILGFPRQSVDVAALQKYAVVADSDYVGGLSVTEHGDRVLVTFEYHDEEPVGWLDEEQVQGWMPSLVQLRADIQNDDLRAMYVGWLAGATMNVIEMAAMDAEDDDDDDGEPDDLRADAEEYVIKLEPPVPPGLGRLTPSLRSLAEFLSLDAGIIDVAAERSGEIVDREPTPEAISDWIGMLPAAEKDLLLGRVAQGETTVGAELMRRIRADASIVAPVARVEPPRTALELATAGQARSAELEQRRQAADAKRRREYLEGLVDQVDVLWERVDQLADRKQAATYDEAVALLVDLRDLAQHRRAMSAFAEQMSRLSTRHKTKTSFTQRLRVAGLI